ncbi:hypothetical protein PR048_004393 [Dryococelus australis]|uniref:Uncharacterized protein n=1 Tax=Dryococelus australis TaxID=614101 RepID=A0ABQ9I5C1_9NEOP|nr:hypothetical protein PR048_004393 [Dryococelus australis]
MFSAKQQNTIFTEFWSIGDKQRRDTLLVSYAEKKEVIRSANDHKSKSERKNLNDPTSNVMKMYKSFQQYFFDKTGSTLATKYSTYHRFFREQSCYSFRLPRTDVSDFCQESKLILNNNPCDCTKVDYEIHQRKKKKKYNYLKKKYIEKVKLTANEEDRDTLVLEFDYSQNLAVSKLNNITVVKFFAWLSKLLFVNTIHIFPVRGHYHNQSNRNFSLYDLVLKKIECIEHPDQYFKNTNCQKEALSHTEMCYVEVHARFIYGIIIKQCCFPALQL